MPPAHRGRPGNVVQTLPRQRRRLQDHSLMNQKSVKCREDRHDVVMTTSAEDQTSCHILYRLYAVCVSVGRVLNCVVCLQHASATVTLTSASTMKRWRPTSPVSTSTARCPGAESARTVGTTRRASTVSSVVTASTGRSTFRWIHRTSADVRILYHTHTRHRRQAPSWLTRDHVSPPPSCCKFAHVTHPQRTS